MQTLLMTLGGLAAIALGAALGYQLALSRERRAGGGKSAKEIKAEFESYQSSVSEHFMESATLLQGMTEQYKKVYEHMARGAQDLCDVGEERPELAALRSGLLAAALATDASAETDASGNVVDAEPGAEDDVAGAEDGGAAASTGAGETPVGTQDASSDGGQRADEAGDEGPSDPSSFDFGTPLGGGAPETETDQGEAVSEDGDTTDTDTDASEPATGDQTPVADEGESDPKPASAEAPAEDVVESADADRAEAGEAPQDNETDSEADSAPDKSDGDEGAPSSGTKVPGDQGWAERFRASGGSD